MNPKVIRLRKLPRNRKRSRPQELVPSGKGFRDFARPFLKVLEQFTDLPRSNDRYELRSTSRCKSFGNPSPKDSRKIIPRSNRSGEFRLHAKKYGSTTPT